MSRYGNDMYGWDEAWNPLPVRPLTTDHSISYGDQMYIDSTIVARLAKSGLQVGQRVVNVEYPDYKEAEIIGHIPSHKGDETYVIVHCPSSRKNSTFDKAEADIYSSYKVRFKDHSYKNKVFAFKARQLRKQDDVNAHNEFIERNLRQLGLKLGEEVRVHHDYMSLSNQENYVLTVAGHFNGDVILHTKARKNHYPTGSFSTLKKRDLIHGLPMDGTVDAGTDGHLKYPAKAIIKNTPRDWDVKDPREAPAFIAEAPLKGAPQEIYNATFDTSALNSPRARFRQEATNALYRVAATQVVKVGKTSVCLLLNKTGSEKASTVSDMLDSEFGEAIISMAMGSALLAAQGETVNPKLERISRELRVQSMTTAGNAIMDSIIETVIDVLQRPTETALEDEDFDIEFTLDQDRSHEGMHRRR